MSERKIKTKTGKRKELTNMKFVWRYNPQDLPTGHKDNERKESKIIQKAESTVVRMEKGVLKMGNTIPRKSRSLCALQL